MKKIAQSDEPRKSNLEAFSLQRKPIILQYNGKSSAKNYTRRSSAYSQQIMRADVKDLSTFLNGSYLDPYFRYPGTKLQECVSLSNTLYSTNRIYQQLLDYLTNMFFWRSMVIPRKIKKLDIGKQMEKTAYMKNYHKMLEIVDGFNVPTNYPKILLELFKNGQVFLYAWGDNASKTMSVIMLPADYCQHSVETQYGTTQVQFNFGFFDTFASTQDERKLLFSLFPQEFQELYELTKSEGSKWYPLNPKVSTCLMLNNIGFPTFLSIFYDIIDYRTYKMNELDRNTNVLERLVTQEIDLEKTGIEIPELEVLHNSIANLVDGNGTTTITSPGKLDVKQLQEEVGQENKALANAHKTIYDDGGFNYEIFNGDSQDSIDLSKKRDENYVWRYVEQLVNFYNLAVNNIYNFGDYQLSFRVLPISPYNEKEKLEQYRANAALGVGVVDFIVATGAKQVDIESTLELEENLDLINRLKPLQSSHVQSGATSQSSTTGNNDKDEKDTEDKDNKDEDVEEKEEEDKNNPKESESNKEVKVSNKE